MSKINTMRIVNLNYNNNSIKISDESFQFNGESTLMSLRNGGGKTVLVQMLTAPFVHKRYRDTKDRPFESYFTTNRPTFIMVEWLLDGGAGYVLTGMMVRKNQDVSEGEVHDELEIVNFVNEYQERCESDIYHVPIIDETGNGMKLKNWGNCKKLFEELKRKDGVSFNYYDMNQRAQSRQYFEKLKEYQINYKEWETIIKKINLKESGLSELFSDCRDEKGLVEKWFLEAVESKLNRESDRVSEFANIVMKYVKQYRENQTKISRMHVLKEFKQAATGLFEQAQKYQDASSVRKTKESSIAVLSMVLKKLADQGDIEIKDIEKSIEDIGQQMNQVQYERISYEIYQKEDKKEYEIRNREMLSMEKSDVDKAVSKLEEHRAKQLCAKADEIMREEMAECKKFENRIEVSKQDEQDREPERVKLGSTLACYYEYRLECERNKQSEIEQTIQEQNSQESECKAQHKQCQDDINKYNVKMGELGAKITGYSAVEEQFNTKYNENIQRNIIGEYESGVLDILEQQYSTQLSDIQDSISELNREKKSNEDKLFENDRKQEDTRIIIVENRNLLANLDNELNEYNSQLEIRQNILKHFDVDESYVYDREYILDAAKRKLDEINGARRSLENEYNQMNQELKMLESGHIMELKAEFADYLETHEINYIYGMDWLQQNGREQGDNEKIIQNNPFIPYSIIMSANDLSRLSSMSDAVFTSSPIPIVKREELEKTFVKSEGLAVSMDKVSFYLNFNKAVLGDDTRQGLIDIRKKSMEKTKTAIDRRGEEYQEYLAKRDIIRNQTIESDTISAVNKQCASLKSRIEKLEKTLDELSQIKRNLQNRNREIDSALVSQNDQRQKLEMKCSDIRILGSSYVQYLGDRNELADTGKKIEDINSKMQILVSRLESLVNDLKINERRLMTGKDNIRQIEAVYEKYSEFSVDKLCTAEEFRSKAEHMTQDEVIDSESKYEAITVGFSQDFKLLEEQLLSARKRYNRARNELDDSMRKYNINEQDICNIRYNSDELFEVEKELAKKQKRVAQFVSKITDTNTRIEVMASEISYKYRELVDVCNHTKPVSRESITVIDFKDRLAVLANERKERYVYLTKVQKRVENYQANLSGLSEYEEFETDLKEIDTGNFEAMSAEQIDNYKGVTVRDYKQSVLAERKEYEQILQMLNGMARMEQFRDEFFMRPLETLISIADKADDLMKQLGIITESYDSMLEKLEVDVAIIEQEKQQIVELLVDYIKDVHNNLDKIDRNSTIKIRGRDIKMLEIDIPDWDDNADVYELRVQDILAQLTAKGLDVLEHNGNIEEVIGIYINTRNLYDTVVGTGNVKIKLYKIEEQKEYRITWADVAKNSGGEGFLSAFIVLTSLLYYMRKDDSDVFADRNEGKVLVMDNPFAQTNAAHLLKPLMDMARKTNTQLICLSGLGGDSIYDRFDNIYVLSLIAAKLRGGMYYLKGDHMRGDEQQTMISSRIYVEQQQLEF